MDPAKGSMCSTASFDTFRGPAAKLPISVLQICLPPHCCCFSTPNVESISAAKLLGTESQRAFKPSLTKFCPNTILCLQAAIKHIHTKKRLLPMRTNKPPSSNS